MNLKHTVLFFYLFSCLLLKAQLTGQHQIVEVAGLHPSDTYVFVQNQQLFEEGWNKLEQPIFWRILMNMEEDSALINIGRTRQIIKRVATKDWENLTEENKTKIRDSIKMYYQLPKEEHIYMTTGKKSFYDFRKVMPTIGRGINVFYENKVDPFYAQAILLIESPNKMQKSPVGAYGSFQIMKKVALNLGLKVNKYVDDRKDFYKSAWASAKLIRTICIPETNKILDANNIQYHSNELWYKLLVLHTYHAGAGNVRNAINFIQPTKGGMDLITTLWKTETGSFRNASQNYSQLALATLIELERIIKDESEKIYNCSLNEI